MRRVLMVSPHFPPDTGAATHRVRLLAPHLSKYGWEPTVVTVDPVAYEGRLEPELLNLVPSSLRVLRCSAWDARWTRRLGFGDLGLRALTGIYRTCVGLLEREHFDALFITIFPVYVALLGPILRRQFGLPFVLDYIDPWVGAWGLTVGAGPCGSPDLRSRLTRKTATLLEPWVIRATDAITAVSRGTYTSIQERYPRAAKIPTAEIPYGGEPADFDYLAAYPRQTSYFDPNDANVHLCYVGTLLPLGFETLRAVLTALRQLRDRNPSVYRRLRLHFFGTSNETSSRAACRVLPVAHEFGVDECVTEIAPRIDYLDALTVHRQASAILLLGSSERHYTASKLYPALLANRPILAVFHSASNVIDILQRSSRVAQIVTYDDEIGARTQSNKIYEALMTLMTSTPTVITPSESQSAHGFSSEFFAGRLGHIFDQVCSQADLREETALAVHTTDS